MSRIAQTSIGEILERLDFLAFLRSKISIKEKGQRYWACCPFHTEKTASFSIDPLKKYYHCFGCGAHGDAIDFLRQREGLSFIESVQQLAQMTGVSLEGDEIVLDPLEDQRRALYALLEKVQFFFQECLKKSREVQGYLQKRGVSLQSVRDFGLGYAPWDRGLLIHYFGPDAQAKEHLVAAGLLGRDESGAYYERFRGRLIFPIYNHAHRVVGFGGRAIRDDQNPKYLNSPQTLVFQKGQLLFGRPMAKKSDSVLLVEGYMDVLMLAQYGWPEARGSLGTALTAAHVEYIWSQYHRVIVCYDGDTAGQRAALRALPLFLSTMEDGRSVEFVLLPAGLDPDSVCRREGASAMQALLDKAIPLSAFFFQVLSQEYPLKTPETRAIFAKKARAFLKTIPGSVFRALMFQQLEEMIGLDPMRTTAKAAWPRRVSVSEPLGPPIKLSPWRVGFLLAHFYPELGELWQTSLCALQQDGIVEQNQEMAGPLREDEKGWWHGYSKAIPRDGLKKELLGIVHKIKKEHHEQAIAALRDKAKRENLTVFEKESLKKLLSDSINR